MQITSLSTYGNVLETQDMLLQSQKSLSEAQQELSTGRYADVNLQLGSNTGRDLNWHLALTDASNFVAANKFTSSLADATQSALQSISSSGQSFSTSLLGARSATNGQQVALDAANAQLQQLTQALNTNYAGQYIFGGQNSQTAPINSFAGAAQTAFNAAFQSNFGFAPTDPQAANITSTQMTQFLNGPFQNLFQGTSWSTGWSNATSQNQLARVNQTQMVDVSANANEQPFKDMLMATVAVASAGTGQLNQATFQTVIDYATTKLGNANHGVTQIGSRIGMAQNTVTTANTQLAAAQSLLQGQISSAEEVDPTRAAERVNSLMTQLETNYAVTGKLAQLSIVKYL